MGGGGAKGPLTCAGALGAIGGLAFAGAFGFAAGRVATNREGVVRVGAGSLGAEGAFANLAGTAGPCRCGVTLGLGLGLEPPPGRLVLESAERTGGRFGAFGFDGLFLPDLCPPL